MTAYRPIERFYPVLPDAAWVARLARCGARFIQLRFKSDDADAIRHEVEASLQACAATGALLVVNDHWQAALDAGATYLHLGQTDVDGADLAALRRARVAIGVSTHDHAELERALSIDPDYVALGPIYPTTLKVMPWAPQGLERIGAWKRLVGSRPLVAIGGITAARAPLCLDAGADSVAVVSDVINHANPETQTQVWLDAVGR